MLIESIGGHKVVYFGIAPVRLSNGYTIGIRRHPQWTMKMDIEGLLWSTREFEVSCPIRAAVKQGLLIFSFVRPNIHSDLNRTKPPLFLACMKMYFVGDGAGPDWFHNYWLLTITLENKTFYSVLLVEANMISGCWYDSYSGSWEVTVSQRYDVRVSLSLLRSGWFAASHFWVTMTQ